MWQHTSGETADDPIWRLGMKRSSSLVWFASPMYLGYNQDQRRESQSHLHFKLTLLQETDRRKKALET